MDLSSFDRWYTQAGTPRVTVLKEEYDAEKQIYSLTLRQSVPSTPGLGQDQTEKGKSPLPIPVTIGLLHPKTG